jgi:HlyD family secretion protein
VRRAALCLLLLAACSDEGGGGTFQGYLEGDYLHVAPEVGGRIVELAVSEGDAVIAGALLFRLDEAEAMAGRDQAAAELARREAELADLRQGRRPQEIAVIEARIAEARASLDRARQHLERQERLFTRQVAAAATLDEAREAVAVAVARLETQERERDVAALPARQAEIEAGERALDMAAAALEQAESRLAKHRVHAPAEALVEEVFYDTGEVVSAGAAVLSLLPPDGRKVVFFVTEPDRGQLGKGTPVSVGCSGCPPGLQGVVTRIATQAEYTPPVIYSRETRGKLMFRAEARLPGAADVPLGQPADVEPLRAGSP